MVHKTSQNCHEQCTSSSTDTYPEYTINISGIICHDPMMRTITQSRRNLDVAAKMAVRAKVSFKSCKGEWVQFQGKQLCLV